MARRAYERSFSPIGERRGVVHAVPKITYVVLREGPARLVGAVRPNALVYGGVLCRPATLCAHDKLWCVASSEYSKNFPRLQDFVVFG